MRLRDDRCEASATVRTVKTTSSRRFPTVSMGTLKAAFVARGAN
jgi:hypothetical protein